MLAERDAEAMCNEYGFIVRRTWRASSMALYLWVVNEMRTRMRLLRAEHLEELAEALAECTAGDAHVKFIKRKNGKA